MQLYDQGELPVITNATRTMTGRRLLTAGLALMAFVAGPARAMTVVYNWVPDAGQGGVGSLTFNDAGIVDPANFGPIPTAALTALNYQWSNGVSITLASVTSNTAVNYTAGCGYVISAFTMSSSSPVQFQLANSAGQCFLNFPTPGTDTPLPGPASNNLQGIAGQYTSEVDAGHWQLAAVPVPATGWLIGSALAGLSALRRRKSV